MSPKTHRLPDAMPEIHEPSLLLVCDTHECRMIGAGGRTLVEEVVMHSKEAEYTDREDQNRGPTGVMSGTDDRNKFEANRLRSFANILAAKTDAAIREQGVKALYISGPGKLISVLKDHLSKAATALIKVVLDGTFIKEPTLDVLIRFRPDLVEEVKHLHDQENYSSKKHLPK